MSNQKENNLKGQYLKEVSIGFLLNEEIDVKRASVFINDLITVIGMELVDLSINNLPPGFDILCTIKESHIYLGYWEETGFVRLFIASCKNFDESVIDKIIKENFKLNSNINIKLITNHPISKEVEILSGLSNRP